MTMNQGINLPLISRSICVMVRIESVDLNKVLIMSKRFS